jgi:HEPN domain-containing protein
MGQKMLKFDIEKTVQYWLDGAEYDMDVAIAMFKTKKYPYALFMGHLALEKLLKAVVVKTTRKHAPYTHSLSLLAEKLEIEIPVKIIKRLVRFMEFHFEARYPEAQKKFYKKCTKEFTNRKMQEIREVYKWLKEKL